MDKLGLGSKELLELNPKLIYCLNISIRTNRAAQGFPGYDPVIQAMGFNQCLRPNPMGTHQMRVAIADLSAGLFTASAILAALYHRTQSGEGQRIDISLQDCIWLFTSVEFSPTYLLQEKSPKNLATGIPPMTPGNLYPAKDGWVIISSGMLAQIKRLYTSDGREEPLRDTSVF